MCGLEKNMASFWLFVAMLVLVNGWWCFGCWEQERVALLQLKADINFPNGTSLAHWVDKATVDCCNWGEVECDTSTRRVILISLNYTRDWELGDWYFNVSLFLPFKELKTLHLRGNLLVGWIKNEGFEILSRLSNLQVLDLGYNGFDCGILSSLGGISSLKSLYLGYNFIMTSSTHMNCVQNLSSMSNLEVLDLSSNYFNNSILSFLNAWPSLKILNLSGNRLNGTIHIQDFDGLNNLKELDLSFNDLKGIITKQGIERVPWLNSLEALDLSNNLFSNDIWSFLSRLSSLKTLFLTRNYELKGTSYSEGIKGLTSLKVLSLQQCELTGTLTQGLCELRNLQELNLYDNMLEGNLPWCLENLTSLRYLDVSSNHFTGNIALSPLTKLTSLEYLALSYNLFQISISFGSFFNHSKLKVIESLDNKVVVETEFQTLAPSFQLIGIRLSNSNLGNSIAGFPSFLYHQHDLQKLELSQVVSYEKFPNWLLENNTKLSSLLLPNNSLSGPLQLPSHPIPKLLALDISNNHLDGNISNNIGTTFPSLAYLNLSTNAFGGNIPTSVGDMHSLLFLDLSNNQLFGGIPEQLALGCYLLRFLNLSNNKLKGPILPTYNNLTRLNYLYLEHNRFTKILDTLSNCSNLWYLFIGHNNLSGSSVPRWMGNMSSLIVLSMPNNYLEGLIPVEFCQFNMLQVLDLSENNISGTIPSCFKPQLIVVVQLSGNRLQGPLSRALYNSSFLEMLDLSNNHLTGRIPHWIGGLSHLKILLLRNNHFEGEVPIQVCYLSELRLIDLSQNNLSGNIPPCINNITFKGGPTDIYSDAALLPFFKLTAFLYDLKMKQTDQPDQHVLSQVILGPTQAVFTTKRISLTYKGRILDLISGIDFSCNKFTGKIPLQIGNLSQIRALNVSHNRLSGLIPTTFLNLKNIESLDLSNNNLHGEIPFQLIELKSLAVFNVSYNNLSGPTPRRIFQFGTFEDNSCTGNPLLCGEPLPKSCTATESPPSTNSSESDYGLIDMDTFYVSFTISYITVLLAIATILCINPHWRRAWFYLIEVCINSCYYFVMDNLPKIKGIFMWK